MKEMSTRIMESFNLLLCWAALIQIPRSICLPRGLQVGNRGWPCRYFCINLIMLIQWYPGLKTNLMEVLSISRAQMDKFLRAIV